MLQLEPLECRLLQVSDLSFSVIRRLYLKDSLDKGNESTEQIHAEIFLFGSWFRLRGLLGFLLGLGFLFLFFLFSSFLAAAGAGPDPPTLTLLRPLLMSWINDMVHPQLFCC